MVKPFQFSLRRALIAMAWFCLAAWLLSRASSLANEDWDEVRTGLLIAFAIIGAVASMGAAVGTLTGHITSSIIRLLVLVTVILFVAVFAMGILPLPGS